MCWDSLGQGESMKLMWTLHTPPHLALTASCVTAPHQVKCWWLEASGQQDSLHPHLAPGLGGMPMCCSRTETPRPFVVWDQLCEPRSCWGSPGFRYVEAVPPAGRVGCSPSDTQQMLQVPKEEKVLAGHKFSVVALLSLRGETLHCSH